jgi:hypothetical protein
LLLGLVTNWVRIFILVLVGYYSQMQNNLVSDHELFGWLLFAVVVFPALYFAPIRPAQAAIKTPASLPVYQLLALWLVLGLGPLLMLLAERSPNPEPWLAPLSLQSGAIPEWRLQPPMPHAGLQEQGWSSDVWVQRWQYQRVAAGDKLVPFIEGKWHPDFSCKARRVDDLGAWYECAGNAQTLLVLRRFDVGRFTTSDFRWAKLWQIPAQWMGANLFSLTQWQQRCEMDSCDRAVAQITALATSGQAN